jgi:NAD(P)-dependent dehydrogenase (short-subunit alcohol dehydrogenase family)
MTYNPMDLTGRRMLVTGGSSGLGEATAVLLSRLGAKVLLMARNVDRLRETLSRLEGTGHELASFDLSETDKIAGMIAELAKNFGPFSGVVHSAGMSYLKPLRVCRSQDFETFYRLHVIAAAQLLCGLTRRGVAAPEGCSVVILGSVASVIGVPGLAAYTTAKSAVLGLVRTAALELVQDRIRVNAVLPGYCDTPMTAKDRQMRTPEQMRVTEARHPMGLGRAEDVANAIAFLLADTGRWITGSGLVVDGGYSVE